MQPVADLRELPFVASRTVIINCGTKLATSLALASAIANTDDPILLVNCESRDGSRTHFERLAARYGMRFHWLEWPLRSHPQTLDALFRDVRADTVLLIDSDLEIRERKLHQAMKAALAADPDAYGSGFLHRAQWLGAANGLPEFTGYHAGRMWIPCTLLRVAPVRAAIVAGGSFAVRRMCFEFPGFPGLSRLAGYRFRIRGLRSIKLPKAITPAVTAAPVIDGRRPLFVEYDTGAALHEQLLKAGSRFAALPEPLWRDVEHYHGLTRNTLAGVVRRTARDWGLVDTGVEAEPASVNRAVRSRLEQIYGIEVA